MIFSLKELLSWEDVGLFAYILIPVLNWQTIQLVITFLSGMITQLDDDLFLFEPPTLNPIWLVWWWLFSLEILYLFYDSVFEICFSSEAWFQEMMMIILLIKFCDSWVAWHGDESPSSWWEDVFFSLILNPWFLCLLLFFSVSLLLWFLLFLWIIWDQDEETTVTTSEKDQERTWTYTIVSLRKFHGERDSHVPSRMAIEGKERGFRLLLLFLWSDILPYFDMRVSVSLFGWSFRFLCHFWWL